MSVFFEAKQDVLKLLKQSFGKYYSPSLKEVESPSDPSLGDFAFPCFTVAKGMKKNPVEVAVEMAAKIAPKGMIKQIQAKGPYVNFFLSEERFGQKLLEEIFSKGSSYGSSLLGKEKRVLVEYSALNTHKDTHIGHLRNIFIGQMLVTLLQRTGHETIAATYIGDLGTHVSRCLWGIKNFSEGEEPSKKERNVFLGKMYVKAVQTLQNSPEKKEEIDQISCDIEAEKGENFALWKKTRKWSLQEMKALFRELGITIDVWYFESGVTRSSKKIIEKLKQQGIATLSRGATIVDLNEEGLGINLLVKSDGTLLYNGRDLGLAKRKEEEYHPDKSLYVIDSRQSLAMQQLFATLKRMHIPGEREHISYEFVTLKDGAMSSREGNVVRYEDFRDQMISIAKEETLKRHPTWKQKHIQHIANLIAFSAIRFGMLRQDLEKKILFDMQEAMSFDGFTGPYILYTLARIRSLLKKSSFVSKQKKRQTVFLTSAVEHQLLVRLAIYPEIIFASAQDYRLSRVPQYLFEVAKLFSTFYQSTPILQAEKKEQMFARLYLTLAVAQVLENGLSILGIKTLEEM